MGEHHKRFFYPLSCRSRLSDFCFPRFSRGPEESHPDPPGSSYPPQRFGGDFCFNSQEGDRSGNRSTRSFFISDVCDSQALRGPSGYFESQSHESVHPPPPPPPPPRVSGWRLWRPSYSTLLGLGLGRLNRSLGRISSCPSSPLIPTPTLVPQSGSNLCVSGSSLWPQGFPLDLHSSGCHPCGLPPAPRDPYPLLPRRLADRRPLPEPPPVTPSGDPHLCSVSGLTDQLGEVFPPTFSCPHLSRACSRYSATLSSPGGSPDLGHSTVDSTFGLIPFGSCPSLTTVPGPLVQPQGPGLGLQIHLRCILDPLELLVPLSPQVKDVCLAWSSQEFLLQRKPFSLPPPNLTLTTDASNLGWGACLLPHHLSGL